MQKIQPEFSSIEFPCSQWQRRGNLADAKREHSHGGVKPWGFCLHLRVFSRVSSVGRRPAPAFPREGHQVRSVEFTVDSGIAAHTHEHAKPPVRMNARARPPLSYLATAHVDNVQKGIH